MAHQNSHAGWNDDEGGEVEEGDDGDEYETMVRRVCLVLLRANLRCTKDEETWRSYLGSLACLCIVPYCIPRPNKICF